MNKTTKSNKFMGKYIDSEKLTESINGLMLQASQAEQLHLLTKEQEVCIISQLSRVLSFIDSLQQEQPEMDLDKEIERFFPESYFETAINFEDVVNIAHHFAEWGAKHLKK